MRIAELSRAMGCGDFVKVEIISDARWLLPDNQETIRATKMLADKGFVVLPYMYPDYYATKALEEAGAAPSCPSPHRLAVTAVFVPKLSSTLF